MINDQLEILGAAYGLKDVAEQVRAAIDQSVSPNFLSIRADNATFGDTWPGVPKTLTVVYRYGSDGATLVRVSKESMPLAIGPAEYGMSRKGASITPIKRPGQLTIWGATYGPADVTAVARTHIGADQSLNFTANNETFGDTWPGVRKTCVIVSSYPGDTVETAIIIETGSSATLSPQELEILGAAYGRADVTAKVSAAIDQSATPTTLAITADNATFGDSWPGVPKTLTLVFRYGTDGAPVVRVVREGERLAIGTAEQAASRAAPSPETFVADFLTLWGASYGLADVTKQVNSELGTDQIISFVADNATFGDSWPGVPKAAVLVSSYYPQQSAVTIVVENEACKLQPPQL